MPSSSMLNPEALVREQPAERLNRIISELDAHFADIGAAIGPAFELDLAMSHLCAQPRAAWWVQDVVSLVITPYMR